VGSGTASTHNILQVRERLDPIQPTLHKLWETLTKILVIVDAALLVLAIDFRLVKSIQGLDCRGADPAILSDMSSDLRFAGGEW